MLAAIALAFSLQTTPPVTRHFVLHAGAHTTVTLHHVRIRNWSITRGGVVSIGDIRSDAAKTTLRLDATAKGATAITIGCGAGQEVWLVDVR